MRPFVFVVWINADLSLLIKTSQALSFSSGQSRM